MKMCRSNLKELTLIVAIASFVWSSSFENCSAWKSAANYIPPATPNQGGWKWNSAIFNVLDFGAKGDGHSDDTKVILYIKLPFFFFFFASYMGFIKCHAANQYSLRKPKI
jgi:hypothetical protein